MSFEQNKSDYSSGKACNSTQMEMQIITATQAVALWLLMILGFLFPFSLVTTCSTTATICTLRGWRNSARHYYYGIAISNLIASTFTDWQYFLLALDIAASRWFPKGVAIIALLNWQNYWQPFCAIFNFVKDIAIIVKIWFTILLCVHRMLIVLYPLRASFLKRIFSRLLVYGFPITLSIPYSPHLWLSFIIQGILF